MTLQDPINQAFENLARAEPARVLMVSAAGDSERRATAHDIDRLANDVARSATEMRAGLVGLSSANGPGFLAALVGLWRAGVVPVLIDRQTAPEARAEVTRRLGLLGQLEVVEPWPHGDRHGWFRAQAVSGVGSREAPANTAVVKLTSGSSGLPRGVITPFDALAHDEAQLSRTMGISGADCILGAVPLTHSYGLSSVALPALVRGARIAVPGEHDPFAAMKAARQFGVSFLPTVPAYIRGLAVARRPPAVPDSLRLVISAGAPLSAAAARAWRQRFGLPVHTFYGASECGGICFDRQGTAAEDGTLGEPVDGVTIEIDGSSRSNRDGELAPGTGAVIVRSPAVAAGYLPPPTDHEAQAGPTLADSVFRTQDHGTLEDGVLRLLGRLDGLINVKGRKVQPRTVERVIEELPEVDEVVVLGIEGAETGSTRVRAVVVGSDLSEATIRQHCRAHLGDHEVPRSIVLVDELPRTERGKVDRRALAGPMERVR